MKKVIMVLLIMLLVGCTEKPNNNVDNNEENKQPEIKKEEILRDWANTYFKIEDELIEENVGKMTLSYLRTIKGQTSNSDAFKSCNEDTSGVVYGIRKIGDEIKGQYEIILDCDGAITTYYYDDVSEGSTPVDVKTTPTQTR